MSIFNDKSLKSVAEAAAKIMEAEKMAKKDYDGDGKIESSKDEVILFGKISTCWQRYW